jgi:hypothetical protein
MRPERLWPQARLWPHSKQGNNSRWQQHLESTVCSHVTFKGAPLGHRPGP